MVLTDLLDRLFPLGHAVQCRDDVLGGSATTAAGEVTVIGTAHRLEVGVDHALALAASVLASTRAHPQRPIVMLADTAGQRLSRRDELLGINGCFAHLAKALDLARRRGARLVTLVYGESVSGGFLAFGLMADHIHALPEAQVRVMDLRAMARVIKQPLETLQALSRSSAVFAPGVENYVRMGAVASVWDGDLAAALLA
ncbi:biotin-independent malonate decarboxylase subunit gamma, partial [Xanthomonas sp. Kuri4-1]